MELIERTQPNYLQSYVRTSNVASENEIKNLIKLNLLSRLFKSVKNDLTPDEVSNHTLPNVNIKVIKVIPQNSDSHLYVGNISHPMSSEVKDSEVSETVEKTFSDLGIELPSANILTNRLDQFSSSDIEDPFRLNNLEVILFKDINVSDVDYAYLENSEEEFEERMFAGTDFNKTLYYDKVRATCILAIDDFIKKDPYWKLTDRIADQLVADIDDPKYKKEIKADLIKFANDLSSREKYLRDSKAILQARDPKDENGTPIATWKIVAAVSVVILGILAYLNYDAFKTSMKLTKVAKVPPGQKRKEFVKHFFTLSGRRNAKIFLSDKSRIGNYKSEKIILKANKDLAVDRVNRYNQERGWKT